MLRKTIVLSSSNSNLPFILHDAYFPLLQIKESNVSINNTDGYELMMRCCCLSRSHIESNSHSNDSNICENGLFAFNT